MKCIIKNGPPEKFVQCVQSNPKMDWNLFCRTEYAPIKMLLANHLRAEQGYLCCYCEEEIVKGISHIEHFRPKSLYPRDSLNYYNLFASCNGCGKKDDVSCGVKKRDLYFRELIKPTDSNCEARFIYTADGQILPTDETDDAAWQTIAVLGLNGPKLRRRREMVYQELENLRSLLSPDDFTAYIQLRLEKSPQGRFCEFWTTVQYFTIPREGS
ncbi:MAG: retron system putative HNH endonuclease [Planctomycetia bacterium]|nr:retron system putative HNH endonuclease [Planctomycetia bacterium]